MAAKDFLTSACVIMKVPVYFHTFYQEINLKDNLK